MNTYQNTKLTDIAWLGDVPSHWDLIPIRALFHERNEKNIGIKTDFILSVTKDRGVIPYDEKGQLGNNKSEDIEKYKIVYPNDLVINKMNVVIGSLGISKYYGAFSHVYLVYYPRQENIFMKYFSYLFSIPSFYKSLIKYCTGIMELRESLNKYDFKKIPLPVPPISEQTAIANFLDKKTAQIKEAIALKSEQIAKLKEYRQTLINQTVTQGLNPTVPMKNSGVEWLGEVPKHWEVKKLKFISDINLQTLPENTNKNIMIDYVDIGSVSFENGIEKIEQFTFGNAPSRARRIAKAGDTIVSTVRTYLKAISIVTDEFKNCIFSTGFAILSPKNGIDNKFLANMIKSDAFTIQVTVNSKGMSYPAINSTELSNLFVVVPPLSEQTAIADFLDKKTAKIDTAIHQYQAEIDKLKEYQQSLVSDVVTGKVKII